MDIIEHELATKMFFEFCRQHPELCPHDYHWISKSVPDLEGNCIVTYKCGICGNIDKRITKDGTF